MIRSALQSARQEEPIKEMQLMSLIKNLFHIALQVDDFDESIAFYRDKLGFDEMFSLKLGDFRDILDMHDSDKNNDANWLTYIRVAPEEYLEVFNGVINPPDFELLKTDHKRAPVFHSFSIGCEDPEKAAKILEERGVLAVNGIITDPSGCKIRIVERKRDRKTEKERLFNCLAGVSIYVNDLQKMSAYLQRMGMKKTGETENSICLVMGEDDQFLELIQSLEPVAVTDDGILGHLALQIYSISDVVWEWGNAGVRCCMQPTEKDHPLEVKKGTIGNFASDGCEIVWAVSEAGNRFEIMRQPGDNIQQKFEREHPF